MRAASFLRPFTTAQAGQSTLCSMSLKGHQQNSHAMQRRESSVSYQRVESEAQVTQSPDERATVGVALVVWVSAQ
ncbi:uncharacterized protein B0H18DRAFT_477636 [Fomitopsis serialis]|uniref:uncharacterized protein n=1 Tax=Fomitopsis serialis TaxID=139415 RepID=UPI00200877AB|nr:uncharacterized protein B0H18DRAFT_477636 [Neoantrodia serialis]KAH9923027.1 hypothetical protein B0H18DRAFT_477636 [Neoantrodia serialis]